MSLTWSLSGAIFSSLVIFGQALPVSGCKQLNLGWEVFVHIPRCSLGHGVLPGGAGCGFPILTQGNLCKALLVSSCAHGNRLGYIKLD